MLHREPTDEDPHAIDDLADRLGLIQPSRWAPGTRALLTGRRCGQSTTQLLYALVLAQLGWRILLLTGTEQHARQLRQQLGDWRERLGLPELANLRINALDATVAPSDEGDVLVIEDEFAARQREAAEQRRVGRELALEEVRREEAARRARETQHHRGEEDGPTCSR